MSAWDRMLKQYPLNLTEAQARYGTNGFRGAVYDNNTGLQKFVGSDCLSGARPTMPGALPCLPRGLLWLSGTQHCDILGWFVPDSLALALQIST